MAWTWEGGRHPQSGPGQGWGSETQPLHLKCPLYLVGGVAVPDDEFPILGGADQQPGGQW
jgi:hypothetical protein